MITERYIFTGGFMPGRVVQGMHKYLRIASHVSVKGSPFRRAYVGVIGVRADGKIVSSFNGCAGNRYAPAHAEARLSRKLDVGSIVYVARTRRDNGVISMARPCKNCYMVMKHRGVAKVIYTISENEWGVIEF